jgi:hypothetical protein
MTPQHRGEQKKWADFGPTPTRPRRSSAQEEARISNPRIIRGAHTVKHRLAASVATVVRRDACNDASVAQAVHRILGDAGYTERVRAISKRLKAEDAVAVACAHLEMLLTSSARNSIH